MLVLLVINQRRHIVMLSAPHLYLQTKAVTNEYLHGINLKVKRNTYSSVTPYWDVRMILCSGPKPTFRSRRRDGIFYNASPDLPKVVRCNDRWPSDEHVHGGVIGNRRARTERVINNKYTDTHWFKVFVFGIVICRYGDAIVWPVYFLRPFSFGFFPKGLVWYHRPICSDRRPSEY